MLEGAHDTSKGGPSHVGVEIGVAGDRIVSGIAVQALLHHFVGVGAVCVGSVCDLGGPSFVRDGVGLVWVDYSLPVCL